MCVEAQAVLDGLDWFTFVCIGCGETISVERSYGSLEDFREACALIYGEPPVCTDCLEEGRW